MFTYVISDFRMQLTLSELLLWPFCVSVCLSDKCVLCDKTKTKLSTVNISTAYDRGILIVSSEPNFVVFSLGIHSERLC